MLQRGCGSTRWCAIRENYCLTQLGLGLNAAPKIMLAVLKTVLMKGHQTREATDSYIDDIIIDVTKVLMKEVVDHLKEFELTTKPPETWKEERHWALKKKPKKNLANWCLKGAMRSCK